MAQHQWQLRFGQLAIGDMQIRTADTAGRDLQQDLPPAGFRDFSPFLNKRPAHFFENHCLHPILTQRTTLQCGKPEVHIYHTMISFDLILGN